MSPSPCVFCRIAARELPADLVFEAPEVLAFLDARPLFPGHVLVVPRAHVETLPQLAPRLVAPLFTVVQRVVTAVQGALGADGSFVAQNNVVSQSVPHLHVHVVPRRRGDGLKGFFWPRHGYRDDAHRHEVAVALRRALGEDA